MPRRALAALPLAATLLLAGCGGGEPEALEPLPPMAPADLCSLLPEQAVGDLDGSASSSDEGDPTAACALRSPGGDAILVTWLQLQGEEEARTAYESQCAAIDSRALPEQQARVAGADEVCAGRGDADGDDRASLALVAGREVMTVRATLTRGNALQRSVALAEGTLPEIPRAQ